MACCPGNEVARLHPWVPSIGPLPILRPLDPRRTDMAGDTPRVSSAIRIKSTTSLRSVFSLLGRVTDTLRFWNSPSLRGRSARTFANGVQANGVAAGATSAPGGNAETAVDVDARPA